MENIDNKKLESSSIPIELINPPTIDPIEYSFKPNDEKKITLVFNETVLLKKLKIKFQEGFHPAKICVKEFDGKIFYLKSTDCYFEYLNADGINLDELNIEMDRSYDLYGRITVYGVILS